MAINPATNPQVPLGPPENFSELTINGETYMPTPHEVNPEFPENYVWSQFPHNSLFLSDPKWYDAQGHDPIYQRRIWAIPTEQGQIDQFRQLLHERPDRGLDLMFAAAVKGKAYIIRFLVEQGVKATANEAEGDEGSLVPLHAAAYQGQFDCVKILINEGKLSPNIVDDMGGTPLMRACWGKHPDIVQYLLEAGTDITIRQTPAPGDDVGTNAFEFACGSGCVKCAELIVAHAISQDIEPVTIVTRLALAAAASSNNLEMLTFALTHGGYPLPTNGDTFSDPVDLPPSQTSALEYAFSKSLYQLGFKSFPPIFAYINSTNTAGNPNFPSLSNTTIATLIESLFFLAALHPSDPVSEFISTFTSIHNLLFIPSSRFTNATTLDDKAGILGDVFFNAAQKGALEMMRLIYRLYPEIDVNHSSRQVLPMASTALYMAAEMGRGDVVEWLFETFGAEKVDGGKGQGRFVNGPTALWIAVDRGVVGLAGVLLRWGGGPVEEVRGEIDVVEHGRVEDEEGDREREVVRVVLSVARGYRDPVVLWSEEKWTEQHGDLSDKGQGEVFDAGGNKMKYMVLESSREDDAWLGKVQLRKSDEELLAEETTGRELKARPL